MVTIHPQRIAGKWRSGIALDVHTLSSTHLGVNEHGHDVYETKRSELGELLYRLKYGGDATAADAIVEAAVSHLSPHRDKLDALVPVPPSGRRAVQPVMVLAKGIGAALGLPVLACITTTREPTPLKGVQDIERRRTLLDGLYAVDPALVAGRSVLLFDDLYRSGATMNAIAELLLGPGKAAAVRALVITRTRSNQ